MKVSQLFKPLLILISIGALSACASVPNSTDNNAKKFGQANETNITAHAIKPDPDLKANTYIPADRDRVRAAREAYRKGEVKEPRSLVSDSD